MIPRITFGTNCYEVDWQVLLKTDRLRRMIDSNQFDFAERKLFVNNVKDPVQVVGEAQKAVDQGLLTSVVLVEPWAREALKFFDIKANSFHGGYFYSISHLVNLYLCTTEYIVYFTADCCLTHPARWIDPCLSRMDLDPNLKVSIPLWTSVGEAKKEAENEEDDFFVGYGFSDQCYLIRTQDYRARIYNEWNPLSSRYPVYAGASWERRVDSWMRNHRYKRLTYKHASYIHRKIY